MSEYRDRIASLADRARDDRESFDPPADPPDEESAVAYLRDGVGDVVSTYIDGRTGEFVRFDADEMATMERALNDWVALYARCYGLRHRDGVHGARGRGAGVENRTTFTTRCSC